MKIASNTVLGLSMAAGALIAAAGLNVQAGDPVAHVQAAPAYSSPEPPPPPPSPAPPVVQYDPNQDYWTGQAGGGGAPGAGGGG